MVLMAPLVCSIRNVRGLAQLARSLLCTWGSSRHSASVMTSMLASAFVASDQALTMTAADVNNSCSAIND
jgi:hypothetical protein